MKRIPIRGGNWNNGSNAGVAALNLNNLRSNSNNNIGFRPALTSHQMPRVYGLADSVQGKRRRAPSPCRENIYSPARPVSRRRTPPRGDFKDFMPKTINNLWDQIIDFENLYQAYKEATQGKRYRRSCIEFTANLEENLITLQNDLIWNTYVPGAPRCFYVLEPKKRMISAPPFRDRVVHHALVRVIEPIIDSRFIYESHACRKGHGVQMAVARLQRMVRKAKRRGAYWHYKGDIKGYFPSIDLDLLKQQIRRIIACKRTLALADTILGSGKGLPIGALTSQLFANLYLDKLDHYAKDVLGLSYIRYMDDFIILDNDKQRLKENAGKVCRFVSQELNLQMNAKSGIAKTLVHFCGFRVRATHVLPRKATVRRASRRLRKLAKCGDLARIRASIMSFLGYMKHCSTYHTVKTILDRTIIQGGRP